MRHSKFQHTSRRHQEGTLERLKGIRRQLIDPKIRDHRGRIVKTTGDGILAEFPSVVDAVRCAVELQRAMIDRNTQIPGDKRIIFRMGINLGDIIGDGDDIYGDGVNIAARLEALAEPGGICISRVVRDQIRDKLLYPFADLGEQSVKNIARPVRSYAMNTAAVAMTAPAEVQSSPPRRRPDRVRTIIAAGSLGAIAIAMAAWWAMPNRNSPNLSAEAPAAASPRSPALVAGSSVSPLSIVVLPFANLST
jgi:adenylate cyclase